MLCVSWCGWEVVGGCWYWKMSWDGWDVAVGRGSEPWLWCCKVGWGALGV